jgi:hypothetical protein
MAQQMSVLGIDVATLVFHVVGMDDTGAVVLRKRIARSELLHFIATLPPNPMKPLFSVSSGARSVVIAAVVRNNSIAPRHMHDVEVAARRFSIVPPPTPSSSGGVPHRLACKLCISTWTSGICLALVSSHRAGIVNLTTRLCTGTAQRGILVPATPLL